MYKEEEEDNKFYLVVQKRVDLIHVPKILKKKRKTFMQQHGDHAPESSSPIVSLNDYDYTQVFVCISAV